MSIAQFPKVITNGLVFSFDAKSKRSFKGKPTTNHAYNRAARPDATYSSYVATVNDLWQTHHPDALRTYNYQGGEISGYVNTGVGSWANTYHAIWTYDRQLKKPVVTMRDVDGQWKAKSFGMASGGTPTAMGLGAGDLYTISWLQWTDNVAKSVNAGMYGANTSGVNNFHDGLSQTSYDPSNAFNTKPYTWERVWSTFQVNANRNMTAGWSCFMYGHFNARGTVKISDVQIETGYVSPFVEGGQLTRSTAQSFVDSTGNATASASNLTYATDGSFSFNGSSDYIRFNNSTALDTQTPTVEVWVKTNSLNQNGFWFEKGTVNSQYALFQEGTSIRWRMNIGGITQLSATTASFMNTSDWFQIVGTYTSGTRKLYINGVEVASDSQTGTIATNSGGMTIGEYGGGAYRYNGSIDAVRVYNRALTAEEVAQNFNALRGRYGV